MGSFQKFDADSADFKFSRGKNLSFRLLQIVAIAIFVFWVVAIIPYLLRLSGVHYLPAPDSAFFLPAWSHWLIGLLLTAPFILFFLFMAKQAYYEGDGKVFLVLLAMGLFAPFMTGFAVNMTLGVSFPMIHTAIFGEEGQIEYVVTNKFTTSASRREGCVRGIDVDTKVFGYNSLCGFDWDARNNLQEGSVITVSGKASRAGIYYSSFRRGKIEN